MAHKGEILWGLIFAWVMARLVFPPPHDPYYIQLVERSTNDDVTEERFHTSTEQWVIGDVPVKLKVVKLQSTDADQEKQEANPFVQRLTKANLVTQ